MKKLFATDVDSVLLDITTPIVDYFAAAYGAALDEANWRLWSLREQFGVSREAEGQMWPVVMSKPLQQYPGALAFIQRLQAEGWKVVAVTKRFPEYADRLMADIAPFHFDDVIITRVKAEALADLAPDAFVDDNFENINDAALAGVPLRFLQDRPWNQSFDLDPPYVRVKRLSEIYPYLQVAA